MTNKLETAVENWEISFDSAIPLSSIEPLSIFQQIDLVLETFTVLIQSHKHLQK